MGRPPSDEFLIGAREKAIYGISDYTFKAWNTQRTSAKTRGIPFRFGLFAWDQWWKRELLHLGPDAKRGNRKGQYMMARLGDAGAYEHGNVYAATAAQNQGDIPADVRLRAIDKATTTAIANGKPKGYHLTIGNQHPSAHPVITPLGRFLSIRLASVAHGVSDTMGRRRVRAGAWKRA